LLFNGFLNFIDISNDFWLLSLLLGLYLNDNLFGLCWAVYSFLNKVLHSVDVEVEVFFDETRLGLGTTERITNHRKLEVEPVGGHGVLQLGALLKVKLDELVDHVTKHEVVLGFIS
jgi:hypothetical protein